MPKPEMLIIKVFRRVVGDAGIPDVPHWDTDMGVVEKDASERLADHFGDQRIRGPDKPTQAEVIGEDGRVIARFRMTPKGVEKVGAGAGGA